MCVKLKCNFNVQKYDILVISVDSHASFLWFWLNFCYPDPGGQNDADPTGSKSTNLVRGIHFLILILGENTLGRRYQQYRSDTQLKAKLILTGVYSVLEHLIEL